MERIATSIDNAADKAYQEYTTPKNICTTPQKIISEFDAVTLAKKLFSNEAHAPYKYSIKNDHIGKFLLLSFATPILSQKYNDIIRKVEEESGWRVKINERCNTSLLQTEFLALFLRNGIDFVKPTSFSTNTIVATIYIKEHLPVCETLKQEIFNTYGTMINYAIC